MGEVHGYAPAGDGYLAYRVFGDGPPVVVPGDTTISFDSYQDEPRAARFFERLGSFCRVIQYDARGVGRSDPSPQPPDLATAADDLGAVIGALDVAPALLLGHSTGAPLSIQLSAARPDLVAAMILVNGFARIVRTPDYPYGHWPAAVEAFVRNTPDPDEEWSLDGQDDVAYLIPSLAHDDRFRSWWQRAGRQGAGPKAAREFLMIGVDADVRDLLPRITVPTLVMHRVGDVMIPYDCGEYLGDHIPGARFVRLEGNDHSLFTQGTDELLDELEAFITGSVTTRADTVLATLVFTDIVGSTETAAALGDRAWHERLDGHDHVVRHVVERHGGRVVNTTGDGFLLVFDAPSQGLRAAEAIRAACTDRDVSVRIGVHAGECERRGDDLAGLTVHIAARVCGLAGGGEILVTRTIKDLTAGGSRSFTDRGDHRLKGVDDSWRLFSTP